MNANAICYLNPSKQMFPARRRRSRGSKKSGFCPAKRKACRLAALRTFRQNPRRFVSGRVGRHEVEAMSPIRWGALVLVIHRVRLFNARGAEMFHQGLALYAYDGNHGGLRGFHYVEHPKDRVPSHIRLETKQFSLIFGQGVKAQTFKALAWLTPGRVDGVHRSNRRFVFKPCIIDLGSGTPHNPSGSGDNADEEGPEGLHVA